MIPEIETKSREEIKSFQEEMLRKQLQYVAKYSPYYMRIFEENNLDISTISTLNDLTQLPVTTKDDLQQYNDDFFCVSSTKIIDYASTSGTTGNPVNFGITDADLDRLAYNEAISFACAGITKEDKVQLMTTMDRRFMAGLAYFLGLRKLGASVIRVGAGIPALQWESIINNNPTYLIAVPSFLLKLIHYAEENNINLSETSVKGAICIGEVLREQDFEPSSLTKRIKEKWDIELYSTYASTEMSTAFTECKIQKGGHHHPELIITELLDENNQPVPHGEIGELTITTLGVEALPLVRFKTGDLLKIDDSPCSCGRNTYRVGPVVGRSKQMIKYKGTTLYPPAIHNILNSFEEIDEHLVLLETTDINTDNVIVKIACEDVSATLIDKIKEKFQSKIRVIPEINLSTVDEIRRLKMADNSRKPRWVVDRRKANF
ncbi:MAG: AMP-binding protein [Brumimicrobium sp.]